MRQPAWIAALTALAVLSVHANDSESNGAEPGRPADWATPVATNGVPNLHRVTEDLYRSAQPTAEGMKALHAMGVKTILNLRSFHSDRDEIGDLPLRYEHLTMKAWHPEEKEIVHFLKLTTNPKRLPILVHCLHGADRTGTMCAVYRMAVQGWSADQAIKEMREGGYGFHEVWANLEPWIRELDIPKLRKKCGIAEPPRDAPPQE